MNRKQRRAARKHGPAGTAATASSGALFAQAIQHHRLGQLFEAEACCRAVLARDQHHAGSLHLLGVIAQQRGVHEEAAAHFRRLSRLRPQIADVYYRLGHSLAELARIDEAVAALERARELHTNGRGSGPGETVPDYAWTFYNLGNLCLARGQRAEAVALYRRALALNADFAEAYNSLGAALVGQGERAEAAACFARALELTPELIETYADLRATLFRVNPTIKFAVEQASNAWPRRLSLIELVGAESLVPVSADPLLLVMLRSGPVRDIGLERMLTMLRAALLQAASSLDAGFTDNATLGFACALAQQCFINEYVFADTPEEIERIQVLRAAIAAALRSGVPIAPLAVAVCASYESLAAVADEHPALLDRPWPASLQSVLTQQVRETRQERALREAILQLTPISDAVSLRVRQQYEENPYPRWVFAGTPPQPQTVTEYLRQKFPWSTIRPIGAGDTLDVLIAGCGTGQHPIGLARTFRGARVLAIDLSLASLSYALRKTRELGLANIEYAQADILELTALGRTFHCIDASGVLHHLDDPWHGWRLLLSCLRPSGLMRIGLYSEIARRDVAEAQRRVRDRGFRPTAGDIRRCRQELIGPPVHGVVRFRDFFSMSECRDLLFHVRECRQTIPQIDAFLRAHGLRFIGFEVDAAAQQTYRSMFPADPAMADLAHWHELEASRPGTFAGMYQFWVQKA